jgi:hypothetical protein
MEISTQQQSIKQHVLVEKRQASSIVDVRARRGPSCDTDHYLVKIKIKEKISKTQCKQREERRRWNLEKFKEEGCVREYKEETTNQITQYQASQEGKPTTEEG